MRSVFRHGVRTKLAAGALLIAGLTMLSADLLLTRRLENLLVDRIREDLVVRARVAALRVGAPARGGWDALADELAGPAGARVTLIAPDGRVLGESDADGAALAALESHADRPEVAAARTTGFGHAIRYSATLHARMLYAAVAVRSPAGGPAVCRLALPLTRVDEDLARVRHALLAATGVAFALALVLALIGAWLATRRLRAMIGVAHRFARGDLAARVNDGGSDELSVLGGALDTLARTLAGALGDLRADRDLMGAILDGMHDGVMVLDADDRILRVNPALRAQLGWDADRAGAPLLEAVRSPELAQLTTRARNEAGAAESELTEPGGRRLLVRTAPLPGRPGGLIAVFADVTELRRLESVRRDFVANASHELRTPVAVLRSAAEGLPAAAGDKKQTQELAAMIARHTERLQHLVDDLLDLSRIESLALKLDAIPVDVAAIVRSLLPAHADRAAARRIALRTDLAAALPPARGDVAAVEQAVGNLIGNAAKYATAGTTVTVRAGAVDGLIRIEVADQGPGIEERHLSRLFERFYRVDAGRSREMGGTGLGLAIVKHLVEAMNGTVGVESTPGHGSTFRISLPIGR